MGFTTGFTGGVTLTLGVAYLTVLAHQRNRERQSAILRANNYVVSGITDPLPPVYPPTRTELAAKERDNLVETVKDKWNSEVEREVRWLQNTDWDQVREGLETAVERLWARAIGKTIDETDKGEQRAGALVSALKDDAERRTHTAADRTKVVASEKAGGVAAAAQSAFANAKSQGVEAANVVQKEAEHAKGSIVDAVGRGITAGKEALGVAQQKLVGAEQAVEGKIDDKISPVERTLRQRYEKPSGINQTVEEALAERYTPIDQRKYVELRGV